ncbi:hypothetical protein ACFYO9_33895 [Streptomyces sp. NPDC005863]|uniref:hypothetical protein n=1 Tax=Streptomyces sp. NPDC005863 TaxID=3364735 RepID=UPI00369E1A2F
MIAFPRTDVPVSDGLATRIGRAYPDHIQAAIAEAADAIRRLHLCRPPRYEEGRQNALADLARANKQLAAWNPRTVYGAGDLPKQIRRKEER